MFRSLATIILLFCAQITLSHHTYTEYDRGTIAEVEGVLVSADWKNPHAVLQVQTRDENGQSITHVIEGPPINHVRRNGVPLEIYETGSRVKVAGWPSRRSSTRMYITNILSEDGHESVLWGTRTRWNETAYGLGLDLEVAAEPQNTAEEAPTLFRVWTSGYARPGIPDDMDAHPAALFMTRLPLTKAALAAREAFDPVQDTTQEGCTPKGMPLIMVQPYPIEFIDEGDRIFLHMEEYDTVRTIHINGTGPGADEELSLHGYSTGRWDGDTLVVRTTGVAARYMNQDGTPLGEGATFVERFTVVEEGERLAYTVEVTSPEVLTEPTTLSRSWIVTPGARVMPFDCTVVPTAN